MRSPRAQAPRAGPWEGEESGQSHSRSEMPPPERTHTVSCCIGPNQCSNLTQLQEMGPRSPVRLGEKEPGIGVSG